ncbi:MAG TPA: methyltransferase domain-containing protein [Actinomycetes bacterium]|nr:methyltransferase domain-containing protein [Actinomycetes bacterium]
MSSTQETFQVTAEVAEAYEAHFVPAFFAQWAPMLLDAAGVTAGQRVLDVACGTGILARSAAARVGQSGSVVGVDLNEAMLSVARRIRPDLDWRQGDAAALPAGDAEFDVVLSQMAMMFFPDPTAALREMRRVTRPGGTVGVLVPGALADNPPYQAFVDIVTRHAGPDARNLVTTYFVLGDLAGLVQLFADAGLRVTATSSPIGESRFGSIDELVNVEIDSTPLGDRLDPGARERILSDCRAALASHRQDSGSVSFPFQRQLIIAQDSVPT